MSADTVALRFAALPPFFFFVVFPNGDLLSLPLSDCTLSADTVALRFAAFLPPFFFFIVFPNGDLLSAATDSSASPSSSPSDDFAPSFFFFFFFFADFIAFTTLCFVITVDAALLKLFLPFFFAKEPRFFTFPNGDFTAFSSSSTFSSTFFSSSISFFASVSFSWFVLSASASLAESLALVFEDLVPPSFAPNFKAPFEPKETLFERPFDFFPSPHFPFPVSFFSFDPTSSPLSSAVAVALTRLALSSAPFFTAELNDFFFVGFFFCVVEARARVVCSIVDSGVVVTTSVAVFVSTAAIEAAGVGAAANDADDSAPMLASSPMSKSNALCTTAATAGFVTCGCAADCDAVVTSAAATSRLVPTAPRAATGAAAGAAAAGICAGSAAAATADTGAAAAAATPGAIGAAVVAAEENRFRAAASGCCCVCGCGCGCVCVCCGCCAAALRRASAESLRLALSHDGSIEDDAAARGAIDAESGAGGYAIDEKPGNPRGGSHVV